MIGHSAVVLLKKAVWHNKEMATKYWSVLILSVPPPLSLLQLLYNVPSSALFWWLITGGIRVALCWGRRLRNNSVPWPELLHDFGNLQCYCVPEFFHQRAPAKLPYVIPLSFSFWRAGVNHGQSMAEAMLLCKSIEFKHQTTSHWEQSCLFHPG